MRKINIEITKARLSSFTATFEEDGESEVLNLSASLDLMTEGGEKISPYSLNTKSYYGNTFNLPVNVITPIFDIAKEIELVATRQCRSHHLELEAPKDINE